MFVAIRSLTKSSIDLTSNRCCTDPAVYKVELGQISADGGFDVKSMDDFVKDLIATNTVPAGFNWREYVDMKYVWAAQKALGLPKRPASL